MGLHEIVSDPTRLAALAETGLLDTPPEAGFDDVVALAAQACAAPVALVSLVEGNRQWFKARVGFPSCETDLDRSVCAHALSAEDLLVIPDLTADPRTSANPLVTGEPYIRFYAGAPLATAEGHVLGSLCVIDHVPRPHGLTEVQADVLRRLARQVMSQVELRRALAARDDALERERWEQARARADAARLEALIATQRVVGSSTADLDTVFQAVVDGALAVVEAASGAAIEVREGEELVYRTTSGALLAHRGTRLALRGTLSGRALLDNEPCVSKDARADERADHAIVARLGIRSMIAVPVTRRNEVIGVLKVQSDLPDAFSARDVLMTQMLAALVAAAYGEAVEADTRKSLRDIEGRYKAIFDSAVDFAIVAADANGTITDWNAGAEQIMGWSAEEVRGQPIETFFTAKDVAAHVHEREMEVSLEDGSAKDERWHLRKGGERFWALGRMMTLQDDGGDVRGFLKILQDRTPQRRAEEAMRESEKRYRSLYDTIDAGFCVIEVAFDDGDNPVDYRFLEVNPSFEKQTGLKDVVGRSMRDLVQGHEQYWFDIYGKVAKNGLSERFEMEAKALDRWFEVYAYPVGDTVTPYVAILFNDVSDRKRSEQALSDSEARWRGLFSGMQEGFFLGEIVRGNDGRAIDYRFLEINPAFAAQSGLPVESVGQTIRDLVPTIPHWLIEKYALVVDGGEPQTFEIQVGELRRWFEVRTRKDVGQRFACLFLDVTERKEAEARTVGVAELGDLLRDANDEASVAPTVGEVAARTLGLVHAGFATVDVGRETVFVRGGWTAPGLPSLEGEHRFREYGSYIEDLKKGMVTLIPDVTVDPRTREDAAALVAIGVRALANVPILAHGQFAALVYAAKGEVHNWTAAEVGFLRNVADRAQSATARLEAEERQRILNLELSHRLKNTLAMVQAIATQTLRKVPDREPVVAFERRVQALANAHDVLLRESWASAPVRTVVEAVLGTVTPVERFDLSGPNLPLGARATLSLSLLLHELATNATKYGALSNDEGRVAVGWRREGDAFVMDWLERGGPPVRAPTRKGFGSRLIRTGLVGAGGVELRYPEAGFEAELRASFPHMQRS